MERKKINEVVAKFAHEVRSPLQKILLSVQMLETKLQATNKTRSRLEIITDAVNDINKLVEELLHSSGPPKLELEALDIRHLIDNALNDLQHEINRANVQIVKDYAINLPLIKADRLKINQVLVNLITNAVQAMSGGGILSISSQIINGRELYKIPALPGSDIAPDKPSKNFIKMIFSDTGVGIAREALPNIFTPFYTTKESGMGLGLPIIKEIVEAHDGLIHVESREKRGSQFSILLPINE